MAETELKFDLELMQASAQYINSAFTTLSSNMDKLNNTIFNSYIGSSGTAIKSPGVGDTLYSLWHDVVDVGLSDFISNYEEWSTAVSLVNATGAEYTEDALNTYGKEISEDDKAAGEKREIPNIDDLPPILDVDEQHEVNQILDINKTYTQDEWNSAVANLSDQQKKAITAANQATADTYYYQYKRLQEMDPSSKSYETTKSIIEGRNPEVLKILEQMYKDEVK